LLKDIKNCSASVLCRHTIHNCEQETRDNTTLTGDSEAINPAIDDDEAA
jgi:hypothetical protein